MTYDFQLMKQTLPVMRMTTHHILQVIKLNVLLTHFIENNWLSGLRTTKWKKHKYKFHVIISGNENITIHVDANITEKNICEKLLGVNFVYKPKFNEHLDSILKKSRSESKTHINEIVFYVRFQLLSFSMDVSDVKWNMK